MDGLATKADHYRARAERVLGEAVKAANPELKKTLLEIAHQYDRLALWAERNGAAERP